jgi:hypothetical protein
MRIYLRLTSLATLLIGLQLFAPKIVDAKVEFILPNKIASNQSFVASNSNNSQRLTPIPQASSDFLPPDNGGPDMTRGSGTR